MTFTGILFFVCERHKNAALEAFDACVNAGARDGQTLVLTRRQLHVGFGSVRIGYGTAAAESAWSAALRCLAALAEFAGDGSIECRNLADGKMTVEHIQPEPGRERALLADLSADSVVDGSRPLRIAPPRRRFAVSRRYWHQGASVHLTGRKFYSCPQCGGRTAVTPREIMPPWPFSGSCSSAFPEAMQEWFSASTPSSKRQRLLSFDFFCRHCQLPVRLVFLPREERSGSFTPDIVAILEPAGERR